MDKPSLIPRERPDLNGLRLIEAGQPEVWLIYHGRRHHIVSPGVYDSLFCDSQNLTLSAELETIAEGPPLKEGTCLVREAGGISIFLLNVAGDSLRLNQVSSYQSFLDFGFDGSKVLDAPTLLLDQVPQGRKLSSAADAARSGDWTGPTKAALLALRGVLTTKMPEPLRLGPGDPVVVCTHGLPPGGAERQWVYLAQGLSRQGLDVTFVVYDDMKGDNAHYLPLLRRSAVRLIDKSISLEPTSATVLAAEANDYLQSPFAPEKDKLIWLTGVFAKIRPKVVFAQLDLSNLLCGIAANLAGVSRTVLSFRNSNPTHFHYMDCDWFLPVYQELCLCPRVILSANSSAGACDYADWMDVPAERISVIPNALDSDLFSAAADDIVSSTRDELGLRPDQPAMLGVFRLSAEKDPITFLEVCARVISERPDVQVLVAGVGPFLDRMERRIEQLGLRDRVRLLGRRTDINVLMAVADIVLLTSVREGLPNVLLEAQLSGVPIVATDVGGVKDAVLEGVTALLHRPGDIEGLARSCLAVLNSPERATDMAEAGRRHAQTFSGDTLAKRHIALVSDGSAFLADLITDDWS